MRTENLSTLKFHKLTQAQYNRVVDDGTIDEFAFYLTPDDTQSIIAEEIRNVYETVSDTYETKEDAETKLNESIEYVDNQVYILNGTISDVVDGTTPVAEAGHAINADNALFAEKDSDGNVIVETYETKDNASEKLAEAKEYTDIIASNKSDKDHKHTIADMTDLSVSSIELNYISGVSSNVQSQLDDKQNTITGTAGQFVVIGSDGYVTTKTVPNAEEANF